MPIASRSQHFAGLRCPQHSKRVFRGGRYVPIDRNVLQIIQFFLIYVISSFVKYIVLKSIKFNFSTRYINFKSHVKCQRLNLIIYVTLFSRFRLSKQSNSLFR